MILAFPKVTINLVKDILEDYVNAVDLLSINTTNNKELENRINDLTEKQDEIAVTEIKYEKEMKHMRQEMKQQYSKLSLH